MNILYFYLSLIENVHLKTQIESIQKDSINLPLPTKVRNKLFFAIK